MAAKELLAEKENELGTLLKKVVSRKQGIIGSSLKKFIDVYEVIQKIDFHEEEFKLNHNVPMIAKESVSGLRSMIMVAKQPMSDAEILRSALIGGIFYGMIEDSERTMKAANATMSAANAVYESAQNIALIIDTIMAEAMNINDILGKLNFLFIKSLQLSEQIIEQHGNNKSLYTVEERKQLMLTMQLAGSLKDLIDKPIFSNDDTLKKELNHSLDTANRMILELKS